MHARIAERLLDTMAVDPQAAASAIIAKITEEYPASVRMFVSQDSESDPVSYAQYLEEELVIGDIEDAIATCRAQMASPEGLTKEDLDLLFHTVSSLQKDLALKRATHASAARL